jgi:hypothetical protein
VRGETLADAIPAQMLFVDVYDEWRSCDHFSVACRDVIMSSSWTHRPPDLSIGGGISF